MKTQLPKAYLRLDPNVDQTHPDLDGLIRLMCAANRQPQRGRFKSRELLHTILSRPRIKRFVDRGDLVEVGGRWYLDGWDLWQEGDLTVAERQARIREKRRDEDVTPPLPDRDSGGSEPLPEALLPPLLTPTPVSEALRRRDVKDVKTKSLSINERFPDNTALLERGWPQVTHAQDEMLGEIALRHDKRGHYGEWAAAIIRATPMDRDPLAAVKAADAQWQRERRAEVNREEQEWAATKAADPLARARVN